MELNRMIDHTILKADASKEAVMQIIEEAKKYHFYSVCINPAWVALAKEQLQGEPVAVCTVIGFPLEQTHPRQKHLKRQMPSITVLMKSIWSSISVR